MAADFMINRTYNHKMINYTYSSSLCLCDNPIVEIFEGQQLIAPFKMTLPISELPTNNRFDRSNLDTAKD